MVVLNCIAGPSRLPMISVRFLSTSSVRLSGHNRWSKIRHKKGAADAQRSALFSRLTNVSLLQTDHWAELNPC